MTYLFQQSSVPLLRVSDSGIGPSILQCGFPSFSFSSLFSTSARCGYGEVCSEQNTCSGCIFPILLLIFTLQSEVVFASLKIMLIIGLIIGGLVINLGGAPSHDRIGFRYWKHPGAFDEYIKTGSTGRFLAIWKVLLSAAFSYGNIQVVAILGPKRTIPGELFLRQQRKHSSGSSFSMS